MFLSAVLEQDRLIGLGESLAAHDTPVLVITGDAERRIPLGYTEAGVRQLRTVHERVELQVYPGEDHFLLFSQPEAVMRDLGDWVEREISSPDTPS